MKENRTISVDSDLWQIAKVKAGLVPLSRIICALLKLWIEGKITV